MKSIDELIDSIHVDQSNFDHISKSPDRKINGTLRQEIKRIAELYTDQKKKEYGYQLHQKIFTASYDLWRLIQRKTNTNPEIFTDLDLKRINNDKKILDANMPTFDVTKILRKSEDNK